MAVCKACGKEFTKNYKTEKYCCDDCREVALKQQWRNASHRHYHKHKKEWGPIKRYGVGTGTLGPHANTDFNCEKETIKREIERLRLKS